MGATLAFPITAAEAKNPVMQEALTTGVANSLGKDPADVKITSIDGVAITRRRRLTDVKIEFEVVSNSDDADAADQLKTDLETAATEGSIVANVQEAANEKGVLVQALQDMEPKMAKPTVKVDDVEVEAEVQEREEEQKQVYRLGVGCSHLGCCGHAWYLHVALICAAFSYDVGRMTYTFGHINPVCNLGLTHECYFRMK